MFEPIFFKTAREEMESEAATCSYFVTEREVPRDRAFIGTFVGREILIQSFYMIPGQLTCIASPWAPTAPPAAPPTVATQGHLNAYHTVL